ncbi:MAG: hypothetical protein ABIN97_17780 [Ginsengibacter sp.]
MPPLLALSKAGHDDFCNGDRFYLTYIDLKTSVDCVSVNNVYLAMSQHIQGPGKTWHSGLLNGSGVTYRFCLRIVANTGKSEEERIDFISIKEKHFMQYTVA